MQREYADPPVYPESLYNALGEAYLAAKSPKLAAESFEKALDLTRMDFFALSGLVRAYDAFDDATKANKSTPQAALAAGTTYVENTNVIATTVANYQAKRKEGQDPIEAGLVSSLNHPSGNITGVSSLNSQIGPKRLEYSVRTTGLSDPSGCRACTVTVRWVIGTGLPS